MAGIWAMSAWFFILQCFYLLLPAYFANMAPVMFRNFFRPLAIPIDNYAYFRGKPLFGSHKTVRGFVAGVVLAVLIAFVQSLLYSISFFNELSLFDYGNAVVLGVLMGTGALSGDLLKSFIKRRVGIEPGHRFIPFDQIDFVIGALLFSTLLINITWLIALTSITLSFVLHVSTNHIAFWLKIRKEKW